MSVRNPLMLAAFIAASPPLPAAASPTEGAAIASGQLHVSTVQLREYAAALVAVQKIRSGLETKSVSLLSVDRMTPQSEADAQIEQELTRHNLDRKQFNAISAAIDKRPVLQRQVHQFVMEDLVGA